LLVVINAIQKRKETTINGMLILHKLIDGWILSFPTIINSYYYIEALHIENIDWRMSNEAINKIIAVY